MEKTIRELAEAYGMSKQAMNYHVKKLPKSCKNFTTKNGVKTLMINAEGQSLIYSWMSKKHYSESIDLYTSEEFIKTRHALEIAELKNKNNLEKLEILQRRAEEDKERIDFLLKSLDQAQQLQAMAESKIKLLEKRKEENIDVKPRRFRKWWKKKN